MDSSYSIYNVGDAIILTATFKNAEGTPTDPTEVQLRIRRPSGEIDDMTPQSQEQGVWRATYSLVGKLHGEYHYRWLGTGAVQAAGQGSFYVLPSSIPN